jgi:hypothetical protein
MVDVSRVRKTLLFGMFLLATGSLTLHLKVHPPLSAPPGMGFTNSVAGIFSLLDVVLVTYMFSRKETASWGYLFNGLIVIYGTVFMTHCGWAKIYSPETPFYQYLFTSTSPDVIIAWADFFMGAVMYRLWFMEPRAEG